MWKVLDKVASVVTLLSGLVLCAIVLTSYMPNSYVLAWVIGWCAGNTMCNGVECVYKNFFKKEIK